MLGRIPVGYRAAVSTSQAYVMFLSIGEPKICVLYKPPCLRVVFKSMVLDRLLEELWFNFELPRVGMWGWKTTLHV